MTDQLRMRARALAAEAPRFRTRSRVFARRVFNRIAAAYGESGLAEPVTGWHDDIGDRPGWRERSAFLDAQQVFAVGYVVCRRCRVGLVDWPWTDQRVQRCGLATAGLAALRADHPGLSWHTSSGHAGVEGRAFWPVVGAGVRGGYVQWHRGDTCSRIQP